MNDVRAEFDDLTKILQRMRQPRDQALRIKKANGRTTRLFLDAGVIILNETLLFYESASEGEHARIFDPLTRTAVSEQATKLERELDTSTNASEEGLGPGAWANRWEYKEDYVNDLLSYVLRPGPWVALYQEQLAGLDSIAADNFETFMATLLEEQLHQLMSDTPIVLSYALQTALPKHPVVREANERLYEVATAGLTEILERVATRFDAKLVGEYSWRDVAAVLDTLIDGCVLRTSTAPELGALSSGTSIVKAASSALLSSMVHPDLLSPDRLARTPGRSRL